MAMYFYIAMEIKDIQGNILFDVPVTQSAVLTEELMKQYSVTLAWNAATSDVLPVGSYVEYGGVRYSLLEPHAPAQRNEAEFEYRPVFQHPVMRWGKLPMFFYSGSTQELDWSLTDNPANFMSAVCEAILNQTGEDWSYEVASDLPASASLSFSNTDIFSALNSVSGAFETEWWFDYANKVLYLSKASNGEEAVLEVGVNIGIPSTAQSKEGYATRFYGFGSTRNIAQDYAGANVNSIVNKRLTLDPTKYPNGYIDIRSGLTDSEILVKPLVFDDIYPRSALTISDIKVRLMWRLDENNQKVKVGTDAEGNPVYDQYAIWYFKIPDFAFSKDMLVEGRVLSVHFNSGSLNGREFELTYHSEDKEIESSDGVTFNVEAGDYEINFIEEGTYIIPAITGLVPSEGDEITLFNIVMPEEYRQSAYGELEKAVLDYIAKQGEDLNNYTFESNKVEFFSNNPNLTIGRRVLYKNGSKTLSTRVIKLETQLDYPFEQRITVGNGEIKGTQQTLKEDVVNASQNIDLLAALNANTEAFQQALQRTQKLMQEGLAADLLERYNAGTEESPIWAVRPKPYKDQPVGITSDTFVTAGGVNGNSNTGLYDRLDEWPSEFTEDYYGWVPSAKLVYDMLLQIEEGSGNAGALDETKLQAYLEKYGYLTKGDANKLYASLSSVNTLNGYFTDGSANDALRLGGNLPSYYATQESLTEHINSFNTFKESTEKRLASLEAMFGWYPSDEDRQSIRAKAGLWSETFLTAGGINAAATSGPVYDRLDSWDDYAEGSTAVLSAKLGYELKELIGSGGSSGMDLSAMWDALAANTTEKINISHIPDLSWSKITSGKPTTLSGYGITDGVTTSMLGAYAKTADLADYLPIAGGTITGNLRLKGRGNYGNYLYFGDLSYAYIAEMPDDDQLTIHAHEVFITGTERGIYLDGDVYINGEAYQAGSDVDLTGYATEDWVENNFVSADALDDYLPKAGNTGVSGSLGIGQANYSSSYKLYVNGSFYAASVTHGSDIRYKSVLKDIAEDIEVIAKAPLFDYTWDNQEDKTPLVGTSAQYWLDTEFRNAVSYDSVQDFYSLGYGELGVAIGILNARKIVSHEKRIKVLEAENAALKIELNGLRRRIR